MGNLKASAAKACITPPESMLPALSFLPIQFEGIYQDLYVRVLILENETARYALITYDGADMARTEDLRKALKEECGIEPEHVLFAVTHSHEAPTFDQTHPMNMSDPVKMKWVLSYGDLVIAQTVKAAKEAIETLRPAKIAFKTGKSYVNVCRDEQLETGVWTQGVDFTGPCDHTVSVLEVRDLQDQIIDCWINFGVHGTCCFLKRDEANTKFLIAGDLPGMTSLYLEERYAKDHAIFQWCSGAAANVNPITFAGYLKYRHDGTTEFKQTGYEAWDHAEALAQRHAIDIIKILNSLTEEDFSEDLTVKTARRKVILPGQMILTEEGHPGFIPEEARAAGKYTVVDGPEQEMRLEMMEINGVALLGVNAEVAAEIALNLKKEVPYEHLVMVTHAGERIGYLPSKEGHDKRTFTFFNSNVKDGLAEEMMTPAVLAMCEELKEK